MNVDSLGVRTVHWADALPGAIVLLLCAALTIVLRPSGLLGRPG